MAKAITKESIARDPEGAVKDATELARRHARYTVMCVRKREAALLDKLEAAAVATEDEVENDE